jgi:hypothetical protein
MLTVTQRDRPREVAQLQPGGGLCLSCWWRPTDPAELEAQCQDHTSTSRHPTVFKRPASSTGSGRR